MRRPRPFGGGARDEASVSAVAAPRETIRRCQMTTPAKSVAMIAKALALECDSIVIDLEDAVAPAMKAQARSVLREALAAGRPAGKEICVRVNGLDSPWCLDDLLALEGLALDAIVVPKVHDAGDVIAFDRLMRQLELRGGRSGLGMIPLIESARGVVNAVPIAAASSRVCALVFGAGDFRADVGCAFTAGALHHARAQIVLAAAAAGVQALDHVHPGVADLDGLAAASREGREMGFGGKWAIHPQQVPVIQRAFGPSPEEAAKARRLLAAYDAARARGEGAIVVDGAMVDEASLKAARRRAALAERIGL